MECWTIVITLISACRRQLDVVFMLDMSGSTQSSHERAINFAKRVVYGLDMTFDRTRVGLVSFGDSATTQFDLNTYSGKIEVLNGMSFLPEGGKTNTQDAIQRMRDQIFTSSSGDRTGVPNIGILVTDGYSNINRANTIPAAGVAKNRDIAMYVVAIGDEVDMGEVTSMAGYSSEPTDSYVFRVRNENEMDQVADQLSERLCQ